MPVVDVVPLYETARERYLNYALSVITSRALPDIRDGLKPVQRRILYAMYASLRLYPDARYRKSAAVVGEVMGKYHPHGDTAIYDAMVRMAQPFSLRAPLVDGHGNFGSLDGDSPAAMRYTEARLQPLAMRLLEEIRQQTVDFRPNFDATLSEPVVLPAQFPNLLVNGATGIAVGMATNIPPHNLGEVVSALIYMIGSPEARTSTLLSKFIRGPDFPTGGRILNDEASLMRIYETGEGPIELRGEYRMEGKTRIIIDSVPYAASKSALIESIADHIIGGKVPQIVDIRDESTDEVRIVLELKRGASAEAAIAYLFKHTPLQTRFHVNLTCLVPNEGTDVCTPARVGLREVLRSFLTFRLEVVSRRLRHELEQLERRIHILKGFEIVFDALDEAIRIIRSSENKTDAAQRLMHRFRLDDIQADAILETKLYKLSRLEIDAIRDELEAKEARAAEIRALLDDEEARWSLVKAELKELKKSFGDPRRTTIAGPDEVHQYTLEDYIIDEDVAVIVTRDGWVKRQGSYSDVGSIRVRDGDEIGWVLGASTKSTVCFLSNFGRAFTVRVDQLPSTTGHGSPVQKLFDFVDKERVVGVVSFDSRTLPRVTADPELEPELFADGEPTEEAGPCLVAVSSAGLAVRLPIAAYVDTSTRSGRKYMRLPEGQVVVRADVSGGAENVCLASRSGHALIFPVSQIPVVRTAAKGVIAMRVARTDDVIGFVLSSAARQGLEVETTRGRREIIRPTKFAIANRGNKGRAIIKRGSIQRIIAETIEIRLNGASSS
jgi:DNA gyrase subunit A